MEEFYKTRRRVSALINVFSRCVLGEEVQTGISDFENNRGYHSLKFDRHAAANRFRTASPSIADDIFSCAPLLLRELADAIVRQDGPYIAAIGELSWLVAHGDYAYAAFQITARRKQYILAQPTFTLFRNVDCQPLRMYCLRLSESFESRIGIDLSAAMLVTLEPGDTLFVNGFEDVVWFDQSGIVVSMVSTLPLGAYEATFGADTGDFVGLFSTEMQLSSVDVALRTFGAAGWKGVSDVAERVATHAVRELRWAALNYMWQSDVHGIEQHLSNFARDEDGQIAEIARLCIQQLMHFDAHKPKAEA